MHISPFEKRKHSYFQQVCSPARNCIFPWCVLLQLQHGLVWLQDTETQNYDPGCSFLFSFDFWPSYRALCWQPPICYPTLRNPDVREWETKYFLGVAKQCRYYRCVFPNVNALCFQLASMKEGFKRGSVSCGEVQSQRCLCSKCTDMCERERNHEIKKKKTESHSHTETTTPQFKSSIFFSLLKKSIKLAKRDKEDCCFATKKCLFQINAVLFKFIFIKESTKMNIQLCHNRNKLQLY